MLQCLKGSVVRTGFFSLCILSFLNSAWSYTVKWQRIVPTVEGLDSISQTVVFWGVEYGMGKFVVLSDLGILTSGDGYSWTIRDSGKSAKNMESIVFNGTVFAVAGDGGTILSSGDGITWTVRKEKLSGFSIGKITYCKDMWIIPEPYNQIYLSSNLVDWVTHPVDSAGLIDDVVYQDSLFVSVGSINGGGRIRHSKDAKSWKSITYLNGWYGDIAYFKDKFVAIGDETTAAYSANGFSWTQLSPCRLLDAINGSRVLAQSPRHIVAAGAGYGLQTSTDGISWTCDTVPKSVDIMDMAFGNDRFLAVGAKRTMLSIMIDTAAVATNSNRMPKVPSGYAGSPSKVKLFDIAGRAIGSFSVTAHAGFSSIPVANIPNGVYMARVSAGNNSVLSSRLVVAR